MKSQKKVTCLLSILATVMVVGMGVPASADQVILNPNGVGDLTELTPKPDGTLNWQNMTTDDADITWIESGGSTVWRTDLYNVEDSVVSGTINSVTVYVKARSSGSALTATLRTAIVTEGVVYYGDYETLTGSYTEYDTTYDVNPQTGTTWTWEEISALQGGLQLYSNSGITPKWSRCTKVWVVVDYTPTPDVYEGLSHGYWKNHAADWVEYLPSDTLDSVFSFPASLTVLEDATLAEALAFQGGPETVDAAQLLLRNAVASVLNAAHPNINYPMTLSDVIADVNAALASGDRATMLTLEAILDAYNNLEGDIES